jgi:Na+/proline symporter
VGPPLFFFPAMAARVFMPDLDLNDANAMNAVYATLCKTVLPTGMIGMVIAAMFSATMSSLAGNFNAAAAVMVNEIYLRLDKTASAARRMVAARVATVLVGAGVVALTFVMQYAQGADDLFNLSNKVFGVFLPPIAIPMLCGIFLGNLSKRAGMTGLIGGIVVGLIVFICGGTYPFLREMVVIFPITAFATFEFLIWGTILFPDKPEERAEVEAFFRQITTPANG